MITEIRTWDSLSLSITAPSLASWGPTEVPSQQPHGPAVMASVGGVRVQPREAIKRLLEASAAGIGPTSPLHTPQLPMDTPHQTRKGEAGSGEAV